MKMKPKQKKENSERWLLTYSDLITLLVALFILMYALSSVDKVKYEQLSQSLSESMGQGASVFDGSGASTGVLPENGNTVLDIGTNTGQSGNDSGNNSGDNTGAAGASPTPTEVPVTPTAAPDGNSSEITNDLSGNLNTEKEMQNLEAYVKNVLGDLNVGASVETSVQERGLTITFKNDVFFDSGSDQLKNDMKKSLHQIAALLNRVDNSIVIEGHTDNVPISANNKYSSNWQLSAARAANVAQYLVDNEKVEGTRLSAVGYGEYRPVASNDTAKGRSQNRRVEIIILYGTQ